MLFPGDMIIVCGGIFFKIWVKHIPLLWVYRTVDTSQIYTWTSVFYRNFLLSPPSPQDERWTAMSQRYGQRLYHHEHYATRTWPKQVNWSSSMYFALQRKSNIFSIGTTCLRCWEVLLPSHRKGSAWEKTRLRRANEEGKPDNFPVLFVKSYTQHSQMTDLFDFWGTYIKLYFLLN